MLAGQQITALTKINARSSEFEPKYLRTSIALWVDGGSQETQYSVLSTRYSVHSVFSSWTSILNTQEQCLAAVQCVVACCCCCCLFDHLLGVHFTSVIGSSWDTRNIMRQVNLHRAAHREQKAKPHVRETPGIPRIYHPGTPGGRGWLASSPRLDTFCTKCNGGHSAYRC